MPRPTTPTTDPLRGDLRLLHDLAVLQRVMDAEQVSARERLERRIGAEFARAVCSLLGEPATRAA
jgi:hypothetical protein